MTRADINAALLRAAVGEAGPDTPTKAAWTDWIWSARVERVVPLLHRIIETTPTDLDDAQRSEIRQLFGVVMCRCVELEHHLLEVSDLLGSSGIPSVVLKGGATAHLDYPSSWWREFSDIDLLIEPEHLASARSLIEAQGWKQGYALPAGHETFTHAVTFVRHGMELDLHQRVAHRALGRLLITSDMVSRSVPFEIAASPVRALDVVDRIVHAGVHAVASGRQGIRLSSLADVLVLIRENPEQASATLERAEAQRVRSLVELAIEMAHSTAQLDVPAAWSLEMDRPIDQRDRLVDRAYLDVVRHPLVEEVAHLRHLGSWSDRATYLVGFLRFEQQSVPDRLRYLWSKMRPAG